MSGTTAGWILVIAAGVAVLLTIRRCRVAALEERAAEGARKVPAASHGPAHRLRRPPGLERDGKPLTPFEERQLGRIEMEALVGVPEPEYKAGAR